MKLYATDDTIKATSVLLRRSDHINPLYVDPEELDDRVPAGEDGISGGQEMGEEVGETAEVNSTDQND